MRTKNGTAFLLVILLLVLVIASTSMSRNRRSQVTDPSQEDTHTTDRNKQTTELIGDFAAPEPTDPRAWDLREARETRYAVRKGQPLLDNGEGLGWGGHPLVKESAVPAEMSDAIIVGRVEEGGTYLTSNKSGVYSEFTVYTEEVLKDQTGTSLTAGSSVFVERGGGRVRFPSGRIVTYGGEHQGLPRIGERYVFFLNTIYDGRGLYIRTAYKLRQGLVFPMDRVDPPARGVKLPYEMYEGFEEAAFLDAVQDAIKKSSVKQRQRGGVRQ